MIRLLVHAIIALVLALVTQLGAFAWVLAYLVSSLALGRRMRRALFAVVFVASYGALWSSAQAAAPLFGRVAISCAGERTDRMQTPLMYCLMLRNFVAPDLRAHGDQIHVHLIR